MGVVLSNLLAGDGGSSQSGVATLPTAGRETAERERLPEAPPPEQSAPEAQGDEEVEAAGANDLGVGVTSPDDRPSLWGHPAPLAKFIALITLGSTLLASSIWGAGWLLVRAISSALAGG